MNEKDNETLDLKTLFIQYLLHWKLILGTALFSIFVAVLYLVFYPKTFEATAQILLQDDKDNLSSGSFGLGEAAGLMKTFGLSSNGGSSIVLDDELVTITSNQLVREMVTKLGLYVDYIEPFSLGYRLYGQEQLKVTVDSLSLQKLVHTIKMDVEHNSNGTINIEAEMKYATFKKVKKNLELTSLPAVVDFEGIKINIDYSAHFTQRDTKFELLVNVNNPTNVAEGLIEDFLIEDFSKSSNVLQLTCQDYEIQRAKDMFNMLIVCFNKQANDYKIQISNKSLSFINARLNNTLEELAKIEAAIEVYKTKNKITMVEYDVQMFATAMQEIQTKLIEIESQKYLIDLMDKFVRDPQNKYKLVPSLYTPSVDGNADASSGGALASYNQVLVERERVIKNSTMDNPLVSSLSVQADRLRESVYLMIQNTKKSLDYTTSDLKSKEKQILLKMDNVPQQERVYVDLRRQQEIYQGVYLVLLQKREEIEMNVAQGKERARIIDAPYIKSSIVAPRKLFAVLGVILFTFIFSVIWISSKYAFESVRKDLKEELNK